MKKNWEIVRLGDLCESDLGKTLNKSHDTGNFHPYLCSINVLWDKIDLSTLKEARFNENEIEKYSVQKGDLLICEGGDIGRCAIWEKEESFLYQNAIHRVRFNDRINPRYCLYYLKHLKDTGTLDSRYGKGVTIKHLVKSSLHSIPIPVPPLPVQARIVDELDCLQGILSKKRQQLAEYHSLAQAIFHQMFGDPVVNEKGWEVKRLGEVCDSFNYGTSSAADENGKMKYLRMNNLTYEGEIILDNMKYINVDKESYEKYVVRRGDILFNRTNSKELVGKTALFNFDEEMIIAGYIIRIRVNNNTLHPQYATSYMNSPYMKAYLTTKAKGAVNQANISAKELKLFPIPLPPLPLQQSFAARIAAIDSQRERLAASIRELETLLACRMETLLNCPQA